MLLIEVKKNAEILHVKGECVLFYNQWQLIEIKTSIT